MKNSWFAYIKINEDNNKIKISGIKFKEFIQGIAEKPKNLLILSGDPANSEIDIEWNLEYISNYNLSEFYKEEVYDFGDFHWIDFEEEYNLNKIDKSDLAKILYFNHKCTPFDTFLFESLNNKYAYFAHDDDYRVDIYMKNIEDYKQVINHKILKEFKGRKKNIASLPQEILDYIYDLCKYGIVIDFEKLSYDSVNIYSIGDIGFVEEAHEKLDKCRRTLRGVSLSYDNRKKTWCVYDWSKRRYPLEV
ncbi:hypothetical protein QOZ84_13245 [Romboutsia sedimentorum]|uniref:Uncharacterized protein n=1 Tax=Romboutsia sedimentorum TaxID=1368474 RepID=A0ABT7EC48_9FIRM|nr:hypothetical protein [Romboutsia sedimentorum]MDK2564506.1 hypothetical protein [Romboutsia sedimentorum]